MIRPALRMAPVPQPPDPPVPEWITRHQGEPAIQFLTRNGFEVTLYPGLCIGRTYDKAGRCVEDWNAESPRALALKLGWLS